MTQARVASRQGLFLDVADGPLPERLQEGDVGNFHDEAGGAVVRGVGDPVVDEKLLPHDTPEPAAFGQQGLEPAGQLARADVGIQVVRVVKADIYCS